MDLQHYIGKDKALREKKEEQEKQLQGFRTGKEETIKKLEQQISQVKSEIERHKEALSNLRSNQEFLLELSSE